MERYHLSDEETRNLFDHEHDKPNLDDNIWKACLLASELHVVDRLERIAYDFVRYRQLPDRHDFHIEELSASQWRRLRSWLEQAQLVATSIAPMSRWWVVRWRIVLTEKELEHALIKLREKHPRVACVWDLSGNLSLFRSDMLEAEEYGKEQAGREGVK